ncbi:hypothetical protein JXB02_05975 [Candidatus Woesearchaeota archaeon]|nr:hypothetical protein [Candidatus Woesearchaeota archaeon]
MGFSSVTAHLIMFIAVMGLATGLVATFKNYVDSNNDAMSAQWTYMSNNIKTDITISNSGYDNVTNLTTVYAQNTGKTQLDPDYVDVYIDDLFIPRDTSNRTIQIVPSTDTSNPGVWDPKEILEIVVNGSLADGSHTVDVATQYGVADTDTFSV